MTGDVLLDVSLQAYDYYFWVQVTVYESSEH